jgi:hypothetical protein
VIAFDATISNPSGDTLYLNGDASALSSPLLTLDDTPYDLNAPISLAPGASSGTIPFELFGVDLPADLSTGVYTGVFTILGGADGGTGTAFDDLADVAFSFDVIAPQVPPLNTTTPEPDSLLLLGSGLLGLVLVGKRVHRAGLPA